jgi:hypothetical protein
MAIEEILQLYLKFYEIPKYLHIHYVKFHISILPNWNKFRHFVKKKIFCINIFTKLFVLSLFVAMVMKRRWKWNEVMPVE